MKLLIQLVREILHLSGKSQGNVREFQTPMAVATMLRVILSSCGRVCGHYVFLVTGGKYYRFLNMDREVIQGLFT